MPHIETLSIHALSTRIPDPWHARECRPCLLRSLARQLDVLAANGGPDTVPLIQATHTPTTWTGRIAETLSGKTADQDAADLHAGCVRFRPTWRDVATARVS